MSNHLTWDGKEALEKGESWEVLTWIPIEKGLPKRRQKVLVWVNGTAVLARHEGKNKWTSLSESRRHKMISKVSHWATVEGPWVCR